MKYIIKDRECGLVLKNGKFVRFLTTGKYYFWEIFGYKVIKVVMTGYVNIPDIPSDILMLNEDFSSRVLRVQVTDGYIGMHFINGSFKYVITGKEVLIWNVFEKNEVRLVDITKGEMDSSLKRLYFNMIPTKYYKKFTVGEGERALLYYDGKPEKELSEGTYFFWNYAREVTCKLYDMKLQTLDISGQEILTADKVDVRLNVVCNYRITDLNGLVKKTADLKGLLYSSIQLMIREYVGRVRLDELLAQKELIGKKLYADMKERQNEFCVEILETGIKDIILPGNIRDIMNTVLAAEKKAQANVIMRREEVASTRSLMNTARLMEENQTLYKLKELEYLERICDNVGNISLSGADGILKQLSGLVAAHEE